MADNNMIVRGLLEESDDRIYLYHHSLAFKTEVDTLAQFLDVIVDGFAAKAREQLVDIDKRMAWERERFPAVVMLPPDNRESLGEMAARIRDGD